MVEKFQDIFVFGYFGEADAFANCSDGGGFGCQAVTEAFTDVVTGFEGHISGGKLPQCR